MKIKERKPVKDNKIIKLFKKYNLKQITVQFDGGFLTESEVKSSSCGTHSVELKTNITLLEDEYEMLQDHIEFKILDKLFVCWNGGIGDTGTRILVTINFNDDYFNYHIVYTQFGLITTYDKKGKPTSIKHEITTNFVY